MNPYLTVRARLFLTMLRDGEDGYGIREGLEAWVDDERFGYKTVLHLLKYCLVRENEESHNTYIYEINEEGERALVDDEYEPLIVEHLPWMRRCRPNTCAKRVESVQNTKQLKHPR